MSGRGGPQLIPRPSEWAPGRPAPWADLPPDARRVTLDRVRHVVPAGRAGLPSPVEAQGAHPSAVLVPVYAEGDDVHVVLTRRSWAMRTHRGEVSFPGGRADPGEDAVATALREACEEIALDADSVEVMGELDHLTTVTRRAYIVPVVGVLPGRPELSRNHHEVDAVLHVPLSELLDDSVFREERWGSPEHGRPVYFFELVGDTVWGATAAMLRQFLAWLTGTDDGGELDRDPARHVPEGFMIDPSGNYGVV